MRVGFHAKNRTNDDGTPTGGHVCGTGFTIGWQDGALGRDGDRVAPNGAFVEDVIDSAKQRLEFFQDSKFACESNEKAIEHLQAALDALDSRTKDREERKVEGTHAV